MRTPDWQSDCGTIRLYHGDCLDLLPTMEARSVDAVIADLPYGTTACKWDTAIPFEPLWKNYRRCTKSNGAIVLTASQPFTSALVMSNLEEFRYCWVWDKGVSGSFARASVMPLKTHEDVCVFSCGPKHPLYFPQKTKRDTPQRIGGVRAGSTVGGRTMTYNSSLLDAHKSYDDAFPKSVVYVSPRSDRDRGMHQTQKPVALMEYMVRTYTDERESVLDNTMGSGTTGVACQRLNRNFIGIEISPEYCEIARKRVQEEKDKMALFAGAEK